MAATPLATQISRNYYSSISPFQFHKSFVLRTGLHILPPTTSSRRVSPVRASSKPRGDEADAFLSQEDLNYLVKVGAGSIAGAAAIKYGSIIFPDITRPNLPQALLIISAPVILSVFLLIKQSQKSP